MNSDFKKIYYQLIDFFIILTKFLQQIKQHADYWFNYKTRNRVQK